MKITLRVTASLWAIYGWASVASADIIPFERPDAAYLGETTLIPLSGDDFSNVSALRSGALTISIATAAELRSVPSSYSAWGTPPETEGATPRVLLVPTRVFSETFSFSQSLTAFGLEIQTDAPGPVPASASFYRRNGASDVLIGTITRDVGGIGGARLLAAASTVPFDYVGITVDGDANAFAVARVRFQVIPEPGSLVLTGLGLFAVALAGRRIAGHAQGRGLNRSQA